MNNFLKWCKGKGIDLANYKDENLTMLSNIRGSAEMQKAIHARHRLLFDGLPKVEPSKIYDKAFNEKIR